VLLTDPGNPANALTLDEAQVAARRLNLKARPVEARRPSEPAVTAIAREDAAGIVLICWPARTW